MSNKWEFFPCSMGSDQAFVFVDIDIKHTIDAAPAALARVTLKYRHTNPSGLPTKEEYEPARAVEHRLEGFAQAASDWYVGRTTVAGERCFYIYTSQTEDAWNQFVESLAAESGFQIEVTLSQDAAHEGYLEDLYPTPDDFQVIGDLHVIEALKEQGDDENIPRKIEHWVYFSDEAAAHPFIAWAERNQLTHDSTESHTTDDGKYCVRLHHHGTVQLADISNYTIALRGKAEEFGGDYDGWETQVAN
jgi:uncharacterized protein (TIGR01619 family)